jgi:hypothetical protein
MGMSHQCLSTIIYFNVKLSQMKAAESFHPTWKYVRSLKLWAEGPLFMKSLASLFVNRHARFSLASIYNLLASLDCILDDFFSFIPQFTNHLFSLSHI